DRGPGGGRRVGVDRPGAVPRGLRAVGGRRRAVDGRGGPAAGALTGPGRAARGGRRDLPRSRDRRRPRPGRLTGVPARTSEPPETVTPPFSSSSSSHHLSPAFPGRAPWGTASALRAWQHAAMERYLASHPRDFLAVATPG